MRYFLNAFENQLHIPPKPCIIEIRMKWKGGCPVKLIIAIIQDEDASRLINELMTEGYRVTKLATTGATCTRSRNHSET